jgi:hypothetical protein
MAINKNIKALTKDVHWVVDDEPVIACTVHALTPHDVTTILVKAGRNLDGIMQAWDKIELPKLSPTTGKPIDAETAAALLMERAPQVISLIAQYAPELIAEFIAVSVRSPDEETVKYVQEEWSMPLQFDALTAIAEVTFAGPHGFMEFVGKVMALGQVGKAIVRPSAVEQPKTKTNRRRMGSAAG